MFPFHFCQFALTLSSYFAKERFKKDQLQAELKTGDFIALPYDNDTFDIVIDRAAITCCGYSSARKVISEISRTLKNKGKFLFNPYSKSHTSYHAGKLGDDGLIKNITSGTLIGSGQICLYDKDDIYKLFTDNWSFLSVQHLEIKELINKKQEVHAEWRIIAEINN